MVFIINGYAGAGKDTFVEMVRNILKGKKYVYNLSTIDYLKDIFKTNFYWNGEKDLKTRNALAKINSILTEWNDIPFIINCNHLNSYIKNDNAVVFLHCREPENIKRYKTATNAKTIFIINDNAKEKIKQSEKINTSDLEVEKYSYNYFINNNGTIPELYETTKDFVNKIILKKDE